MEVMLVMVDVDTMMTLVVVVFVMLKDVYDDDGLDDIHHHDNDYYYYYNDGLKVLAVNQIIIIHYNDDVDVHDVYDGHDVKNYLYDDVIQILMIYPMRNVMLILYPLSYI